MTMGGLSIKRNERDWAGQLVSWIKSAIDSGRTVFQDVTNDTGVKLPSGRTKFPDILLFIDKISGVIFNGWELKFPDTTVDDAAMLGNALEKAERMKSDSFVTWNGSEAVIWKIDTEKYSIDTLKRLKTYPQEPSIASRDDLADPVKYAQRETLLRNRAHEILHDLDNLYRNGRLKPAINVSADIIQAIKDAARMIIPQFHAAIAYEKGANPAFRQDFAKWKIYESYTLSALNTSSRKQETVKPEAVLAKFMFYNLMGKILLYQVLSGNLSGELEQMRIGEAKDVKPILETYFNAAKAIDFQAIFKPYFTDGISFSDTVNAALTHLVGVLSSFDFRLLPATVVGNILENLVPEDERQKFGQYFTPYLLACMAAYPVVLTRDDILFDPTSGAGTFLNAFYEIKTHFGKRGHKDLLSQIWGNDISHFPAILSVINLYKQDVTETDNFPRVIRDDFFNLEVGKQVEFPSPYDHRQRVDVPMPLFDGIAGNFPFIQQEDIPNGELSALFEQKFGQSQMSFIRDGRFKINERSDYFAYCIYNALDFLKPGGRLACITSNAWLGKEYGMQFKRFLLDNFHVRYVVRSAAEHWFKDSQVSAVYLVLEKGESKEPTRFVTVNFKLEDRFSSDEAPLRMRQIEDFYNDIDTCNDPHNASWRQDKAGLGLFRRKDDAATVCIVGRKNLFDSLEANDNWAQFFVSADLFGAFDDVLTPYYPEIANVLRGERTGWDKMFVIKDEDGAASRIARQYLLPYVKRPQELTKLEFNGDYHCRAFVCCDAFDSLDDGTKAWISKFQSAKNKNGSKTIEEACSGHRPFWYSLHPKKANVVTAVNPYNRFFFAFSSEPFAIDQRLIGMQVRKEYDVELIAALLNSALTYLIIEMRGSSRNQGALDLNANYLKRLRLPNPNLLDERQKRNILQAFAPLRRREVMDIAEELANTDRINFDRVVLKAFGIDTKLQDGIYRLLASSVAERISLKNK